MKYAGGALLPTLRIDRDSGRPIVVQLVSAIRELILQGVLEPGQRLPSSRTFAIDHGISRTTAIAVYESLTAEGLIVSRVGSGSHVSDVLKGKAEAITDNRAGHSQQPTRLASLAKRASEQFFPRLSHPTQPRPFVTGLPALDLFPIPLWSKLTARHWRTARGYALGYPEPGGLMELRRAIATHLRANRGVVCDPEEVFILNGAQEAFNRIGNTLLDPGDAVWFENPGPIGARNSLLSSGARLVPVPVDEEGINVAAGLEAEPNFRLAFVTPSHQHPLGAVMSLQRRFELLQAAERADAWIVEDDYDGEFYYSGHPPPTLKSVDTVGRVIYVGTFSKSLFPALRIAFMVASGPLAQVFDRIAGATLQGASTMAQAVVASFIEEGHFASHIRRMRKTYMERHEVLIDAATKRLAGAIEIKPTDSGIQTVGHLVSGHDEVAVAEAAASRDVIVAPLSRFAIAPMAAKGFAIGFSTSKPAEIRAGVERLAAAIDSIKPSPAGNGPEDVP
jgi:GntR family transcriptional regulator/MocR family aminotransferase